MTSIVDRNVLLVARIACSSEDVRLVVSLRLMDREPSGDHGNSPVDTLTASSAMQLSFGLEKPSVGAGAGITHEVLSFTFQTPDNLRLRRENKWVINNELSISNEAGELGKFVEREGMSCSRRPGTKNFVSHWEVDADDAVLKEPDAISLD